MYLRHNLGTDGPSSRSPAPETVLGQEDRDYLIGRLLPARRQHGGILDTLDEALARGALTREQLEAIIAAAEGHPH